MVQARQVLQTTSPSLVLLAVLDEVRRVLALQEELVERAVELGRRCARELAALPNVEVVPEHLNADPTRIVFSCVSWASPGRKLSGSCGWIIIYR